MSDYNARKQTFEVAKQVCIEDYQSGEKTIEEIESMLISSGFNFEEVSSIIAALRCTRVLRKGQ